MPNSMDCAGVDGATVDALVTNNVVPTIEVLLKCDEALYISWISVD